MNKKEKLQNFNNQQQKAITFNGNSLAVIAGAGSGKTSVLTYRVFDLIKNRNLFPGEIMAVTFTNKAANEIKNRLHAMKIHYIQNAWIGTFHNIGLRILRSHFQLAGLKKNFGIIGPTESEDIIKQIVKDYQLEANEKKKLISRANNWISTQKDKGLQPEDVNVKKMKADDAVLLTIYKEYKKECLFNNIVDLGDLILLPLKIIQNQSDIRLELQNRFKHFLIDEFQDTNDAQYQLIALLSDYGKKADVTIVGDMDQSIYSWRGAKMQNMPKFIKEYSAEVIKLEQNYRSTGFILSAASQLITNNKERIEKTLWTDKGDGNKVNVWNFRDSDEESQYIAGYIKKAYLSKANTENPISYKDFCVLYRSSFLSRKIEEALIKNNIPYKIHGGIRFFDRAEIKDALAILKLTVDRHDNYSLERTLKKHVAGFGEKFVNRARDVAYMEEISIYQFLSNFFNGDGVNDKRKPAWDDFIKMIEFTAQSNSLESGVKFMINASGLMKKYKDIDIKTNSEHADNLEELTSYALDVDLKNHGTLFAEKVMFLIDDIALNNEKSKEGDLSLEQVNLMTIHAAKGLEFPYVFITGCEHGIFPSNKSMEKLSSFEEERRLAYVAFTRAEKLLTLSHVDNRYLYGEKKMYDASRFIEEIPSECKKTQKFS